MLRTASGEAQHWSLAVRGSVTMSFPVFWEYSFKAALKIALNCKDDDESRWEFEDMKLVERQ